MGLALLADYLADYLLQHLLLRRKNLVVAAWGFHAAPWIDHQFALTYVLMGVVFVAAQGALGWLVWKYRDRPSPRRFEYSHGNTTLELLWTTLDRHPLYWAESDGKPVWASERFEPAQAGSVPVEVTGMQFAWYFRYPGATGNSARTDPKLMDPSAGNEAAVGLDTTDPAVQGRCGHRHDVFAGEPASRSDAAGG